MYRRSSLHLYLDTAHVTVEFEVTGRSGSLHQSLPLWCLLGNYEVPTRSKAFKPVVVEGLYRWNVLFWFRHEHAHLWPPVNVSGLSNLFQAFDPCFYGHGNLIMSEWVSWFFRSPLASQWRYPSGDTVTFSGTCRTYPCSASLSLGTGKSLWHLHGLHASAVSMIPFVRLQTKSYWAWRFVFIHIYSILYRCVYTENMFLAMRNRGWMETLWLGNLVFSQYFLDG